MEEKKLKKLPLGLSDFGEIVTNNYVYVDKTRTIHQLITSGKYYFLSRPRRFGKSLLVSTLHALFAGKKELFKDLWIYSSGYDWPEHPVIRLDFSAVSEMEDKELQTWITEELQGQADNYGINLGMRSTLAGKFEYFIEQLSKRNKVVVLIDEYDKPILDHITESREALAQRKILKKLYSVLKSKDAYLRFVLLTGVSKFSKTSIFSGINNLMDITLNLDYAQLLGYTHDELVRVFAPHLQLMAHKQQQSIEAVVHDLQKRYDGYMFAAGGQRLFNPFSILTRLKEHIPGSYWFSTGTPAFIINLLKNKACPIDLVYDPVMSANELDAFEPDDIHVTALLYQSGYLTIKKYEDGEYTLDFPNFEVADGFNLLVSTSFTGLTHSQTKQWATRILQVFKNNDISDLQRVLQEFFDSMTYDAHVREEYDFKLVLLSSFKIIGLEVNPEVKTSRGRADLVVELPGYVYVLELKFDKTAQQALDQIKDKEYYSKYLNTERQITLVGVNFESEYKKVSVLSDVVRQNLAVP